MTHQVPEHYPSMSECLSNILENIGYSHEDRDMKVRDAIEYEMLVNISSFLRKPEIRFWMFGSNAEGSTGPRLQSDIDLLYQTDDFKVVTDLNDCQAGKINCLMVKDTFTHPGYVKLQAIHISPDNIPIPLYYNKSVNKGFGIDALHRVLFASSLVDHIMPNTYIRSGPALHITAYCKELSSDNVFAVRCSQCPREEYEWFQRRRLYGWPSPQQIENAWKYGCFATGVGHPYSSEQHLEWRLSFSLAERSLTRSFEDTVMKVYILLKMIKKTYIAPVIGDAFSSYHCKVCMLWTRERTPRDLWNNGNLLYCLILCITQLHEWATEGFCPDYFIVTNNIYDRNIFGAKQSVLVQILRDLLSTDCRFLLGITCCRLGKYLANGISGLDFYYLSNGIYRDEVARCKFMISTASYCRYVILRYIPQCYPTLIDYIETLMYVSKHLPYIIQHPLKYILMVLWSQLGFHIATVCRENARLLSGEEVNYLMALASSCLSLGIKSDVTSVRLKLCGLGMELGYYDLMEVCLQHIKDCWMRYMYSATVDTICPVIVLNCNLSVKVGNQPVKRMSAEEILQTQVSFTVVYMPSEISITPKPLRMEMFRSIGAPQMLINGLFHSINDWGVVDSLICLYFFLYLNYSRQKKERHKQVAMENMIHMIRTEPRLLHRDTALNLLGYSFLQENQITNAFICFTRSLKIRPYHNAARFYLGLLFKRVHRRQIDCGSVTT